MTVSLRPVESADEAAWRDLWGAYLAFYETTLPEEVYAQTFRRIVTRDHPGPYGLLAEIDGKPVGLVHYLYHRSGWKLADTCYLQDLFVVPDARGSGAARALIEAVYAAADRDGAVSVYWMTQEHNHRARALYDKVATRTPFIRYVRTT